MERALRLAVSPIRNINVRDAVASGDGSWIVEGYAAVFEQDTVLYDGKWFRVREIISRGAFDNVLQRVAAGDELVHLNHGHDMTSAVASSEVHGVGGLRLSADEHGLKFTARVDAEDPDAIRMAAKMRRGVVAQASFAFTIADEEVTTRDGDDGKEEDFYRINEVGSLYDVCACAQGAYSTTSSAIRTAMAASLGVADLATLDRSGLVPEGHEDRSDLVSEGSGSIAPAVAGRVSRARVSLRATVRDIDLKLKEGKL